MAIFKATAKRNDGGSSFAALVSYIARDGGNEADGQSLPMETNCLDIETAGDEMQAVAAMNPRVKDPVYHFLVSLRRGEHLPEDAMFDIARDTMKELGFEGHQYAAAIHSDTDNLHVHVALNRVHPETFKAVYPDRDYFKGAKCMCKVELRHGLEHDNGPFAVFERDGKTVIDWKSKDPNTKEKTPAKARDMEVQGRESLFSYARGEPRKAVTEALKSPSTTWAELHQVMGRYGLELREKGQGFAVYDKGNPEQTPIKASDMHERLSKSHLEKQLGPYQPAPEIEQPPEQTYNPERKPKHDPRSREQRAEERTQQRMQLRQQYDQARKPLAEGIEHQVQQLKSLYAQKGKDITVSTQAERKAIRAGDQPAALKKALLSVLAAETIKLRVELREQMKRDRAAIGKPPTFREWVADQAEQGDPAAISQLRGFLYADKRKLRQLRLADVQRDASPGFKSPDRDEQESVSFGFKTVQAMTYQVNRQTGDVSYLLAGRAAFTDYGRRITFDGQASNDEAAILAGLQVAQAKFGQTLELTGSDEFKHRVAEVAAKHGLRITLTDPSGQIFAGAKNSKQRLAGQQTQPERAETAGEICINNEAEELVRQLIGPEVKLRKLSAGAVARGKIVGETAHHLVQRISGEVAAIHEKHDFDHLPPAQRPQVGQHLAISIAGGRLRVAPVKSTEPDRGHAR